MIINLQKKRAEKVPSVWYACVGAAALFLAVGVLLCIRDAVLLFTAQPDGTVTCSMTSIAESDEETTTLGIAGKAPETADASRNTPAVISWSAPFFPDGRYGDPTFRDELFVHRAAQTKDLQQEAEENAALPPEERSSLVLPPERLRALEDSGNLIF